MSTTHDETRVAISLSTRTRVPINYTSEMSNDEVKQQLKEYTVEELQLEVATGKSNTTRTRVTILRLP